MAIYFHNTLSAKSSRSGLKWLALSLLMGNQPQKGMQQYSMGCRHEPQPAEIWLGEPPAEGWPPNP